MKRSWLSASLVLCLLGISACSSIKVNVDYDPKAQFSSYQSYAWLPQPSGKPRIYNDIIDKRVRAAVDQAMREKGFRKVKQDQSPTLFVTWSGAIEEKLDVRTINDHYGYSWGTPYVSTVSYTSVRKYEEGTLVVDLADAKARQLIWRGQAQAELDPKPSPEKSRKRINEAVQKMFKNFPPN